MKKRENGITKVIWVMGITFISYSFVLMGCGGERNKAKAAGDNGQLKQTMESVTERTTPVVITFPKIRKLSHYLNTVGQFIPEDEVAVGAKWGGVVEKIFFDEGDIVKEGDLLLEMDHEEAKLNVDDNRAKVGLAKARVANLEKSYKRKRRLFQDGIIGRQQYEDVETELTLAKKEVEKAQAELALAEKRLRDTKIISPISGVISQRFVSVGEIVSRGDVREKRSPLFRIVQIKPIKLEFTISERVAKKIYVGQRVKVKVKAYPEEDFYGTIYFIDPQLVIEARGFRCKARFDNQDGRLKPGFFANIFLVVDENVDALTIPQEALVTEEDGTYVFIANEGKAKRKKVVPGIFVEGEVEILDGLKGKERVIAKGNQELIEGTKVKILREDKAPDR